MYKDELRASKRKFGQPQAVVSAHLEKFSSFPPLELHNIYIIINFSGCVRSHVGVFKLLLYDLDLKSAALHGRKTLSENYSSGLQRLVKGEDRSAGFNGEYAIKSKTEDTINPVTKPKVSSKAIVANTQPKSIQKSQQSAPSTSIPCCIVCKGSQRMWECSVFKEKTPAQRAKVVGRSKALFLLFA